MMKTAITFASTLLLMAAFLYPLFFLGIGRPVSWMLVAGMAAGGVGCIYILVKYRKKL
jgi:hypothetical protein